MSVPVPVEELADAVARYGPVAYLLTTGDDMRPHATHVVVEVDGGTIRCGIGRRTARNAAERSAISLLWSPNEEGDYSLIVDGDIEVTGTPGEDAAGVITVTHAILHRTASAPTEGDCDSDCKPVDIA